MNRRTMLMTGAAIAAVFALAGPAGAWEPEEPIKIVVGFSPGGGTDTIARAIASAAQEFIPVPLVVVNQPGASGTLAADMVAKAEPDGTTLLMAGGSESTSVPNHREVGYDLEDDFRPVIRIAKLPIFLVAKADSGIESAGDLVQKAKQDPGGLSFASSGAGSLYHSTMLVLNDVAGTEMKHVPYKGGAPAMAALLGGHVDVTLASPDEAKAQAEAGAVNLIGVASDERVELFPDVPTLREQGYDVYLENMKGLVAPEGLADERYQYLHDNFKQAIESETFQQLAEKAGIIVGYMPGPEFEATMTDMSDTIGGSLENTGS